MPMRTALLLTTCALAAGLVGCERKAKPPAADGQDHPQASAPSAAAPSAQLWRVEVVEGGKVSAQQDVCADEALRAGFARPAPEINGQPCVRVGEAVEREGTYSVRCNVGDQQYRVGATTKGDPSRDFTVETAVAAQGRTGPSFEQVRRYRLLGACPAGWAVADAAAPGSTRITNGVTGAARSAATAAP